MPTRTILMADNAEHFLSTRKEFLLQEGYRVLTATDPQEARKILTSQHIDLAILDIRLENDDDENDLSGIRLAREVAPEVPKIMLTGFPTVEIVRKAMRPWESVSINVVIKFLSKQEGPEVMVRAVEEELRPKVFLVHGTDEATKDKVASFLRQLQLRVIVLHEEPNAGRAIIEKFEHYAKTIGLAVVLLTPDDFGRRARQNVIFELGYFMARLGRDKVVSLYKEEIDIPSELNGLLTLKIDEGNGWKFDLAIELREAGIEVRI